MSSVRAKDLCLLYPTCCYVSSELEYMFNQLDMVLKVLPEYAERAASKLRASGEHDALSNGPFNPTTNRPVSVKLHVRRVRPHASAGRPYCTERFLCRVCPAPKPLT